MTTMPHLPPHHLPAEDVPSYWQVGILWNVLLSADATAGQFTLIDQTMPRDAGPPPHVHERYDEGFHLLDGEIEYTLGTGDEARTVLAKTGDTVWVPRGTEHSFRVTTETVRALNFYTPGGWETGLAYMADQATAKTLPPDDTGFGPEGVALDPDRERRYLARIRELNSQTGF